MKALELEGQRFGDLTVISKVSGGTSKWLCRCDCGKETTVYGTNLKRGLTTSCGCGRIVHGDSYSLLYRRYQQMKYRAGLCPEWMDYKIFKQWAIDNGYAEGCRFFREDVSQPYSPENCKIIKPT